MALINPHYSGQRVFTAQDEATPSNQLQFKANAKIEFVQSTGKLIFTPTALTANTASYYNVSVSQGELYKVLAVSTAVPAAVEISPIALGFAANKPVQLLFEARGAAGSGQAERIVGTAVFEDLTVNRTVTFNNL